MPNEHRIKAVVDIGAQIQGFERGVNQMKSALSQVQLSDNMDKDLKEMFANATRQIETMKKQIENNPLELVDIKQLRSDLGELEKIYKRLGVKFESAQFSGSDSKKEAKAIENLIKIRKNYNESIKDSEKALGQENKTLERLKNNLATYEATNNAINKSKEDALKEQETVNKAYQEEIDNVNKLKKELDELVATRDANKAKQEEEGGKRYGATKAGRQENADIVAKQQEYNAAVERQNQLKEAAANATKNAENATNAAAEAEKKYSKNINETNAQIKGHEERVKELEATLKEKVAGALEEVRNSLKESDIAWEEFGIEPDKIQNINDLENALSRLDDASSQKVTLTLDQLRSLLQQVGEEANHAEKELDNAEEGIRELTDTQKDIQRLGERLKQFFSIGSAVQLFRKALRSAYETIKDLDAVMTETAVVTDFTVGDMWSQLPEYTQRANELGISIHSAYEAATIYYQQGLKTNEVMAVSNETLKMARIAGLDAATATDRMTNALRGFNMEINETNAQRIADVYSKLAAMSASNVDEISTAMTKVASLASSANMQFETTAAFLSQIIETTRESAETAGTALKTIVARFSEVKELYSQGELFGTDEEGEAIDVNKVGKALRTAGIDLNEFLTGSKGLDEILLDLASKWDSLDIVQQRYIATMAAGSRQQSRFIAMMQDYKRTTELVTAANDANGASQQQYNKTLESLDVKLTRLKNAWAEFTMSIMNSDVVKFLVDAATAIVQAINKLTDALPGATSGLAKLGIAAGGLFAGKKVTSSLFGNLATAAVKGLGLDKVLSDATGKALNTGITTGLKEILKQKWGSKLGLTIGKEVASSAATGLTANASVFTKALGFMLSPTGLIIAAGAVIGGLLIKAIVSSIHENSIEGKLEKLEKNTEELREAANKAAEAYADINDYASKHDAAIKSIGELKQGTEEWYQAIKQANEETRDLIDKYDYLSQYELQRDPETGVISFSKEDLNKARKAERIKESGANYGTLRNEQMADELKLFKYQNEFKNGFYTEENAKDLFLRKTNFEDIIANFQKKSFGVDLTREEISKIKDSKLEADLQDWGRILIKTETTSNNQRLRLIQTLSDAIDIPEDFQKKFNITGVQLEKTLDNFILDFEKQADIDVRKFEDVGAYVDQNRYAKTTEEGPQRVDRTYKDLTTGKWLTNDEVTKLINEAKTKRMSELAEEFYSNLLELIESGGKSGDITQRYVEGGTGNLTLQDLDYLSEDLDFAKELFGPEAEHIVSDLKREFVAELSKAPAALRPYLENMSQKMVKGFNAAFGELGPNAQKTILETFNEIGPDLQKEFSSIIAQVTDWSDSKQLTILRRSLLEEGLPEDTVNEFVNRMAKINVAIIKTTPTDEELQAYQNLAKGILNAQTNGTASISGDTYELLLAQLTKNEQKLFRENQLTGEFDFLGTAEEFNKLIKEKFINMLGAVNEEVLYNTLNQMDLNDEAAPAIIKAITSLLLSVNPFEIEKAFSEGTVAQQAAQNAFYTRGSAAGMNNYTLDAYMGQGGVLQAFEKAKGLDLSTDDLTAYAEQLMEVNEKMGEYPELAFQNAVTNARLNRGVADLVDNYEDWCGVLFESNDATKQVNKESPEYAEALNNIRNILSDITDIDLDESFNVDDPEILKLVENLALGDLEAIDQLQQKIFELTHRDIIEGLNIPVNAKINEEEFDNQYTEFYNWLLQQELPELVERPELDNTNFIASLDELLKTGAIGVEDLNKIFDTIGYDVEVGQKTVSGTIKTPVMDTFEKGGKIFHVSKVIEEGQSYQVPYIHAISRKPSINASTRQGMGQNTRGGSTSKPSGSGSKGSSSKESVWKNPYDELYNLVEKVNEALRDREKLEREYDRILKDRTASVDALHKNSLDEIANLRREIDLQEQLLAGRRRQLANLGQEKIEDENGNLRTLASYGVEKYASYDESTGLITIDWEGIDKIRDTQVGAAIEQYISRIEELSGNIEEAQDNIEEMKDLIQEIKERNMGEYLEFEDRIYQALVDQQQKIIDNYSELNDTINDTNDRILNSLRESIDMERQIRDNTEKEQDIADMENRLAYLRRDTSGANALEIKKLEENLEKARQDQSDTLIDQAIDKLGQDNDKAAEQRAQQIELMQAQLDWQAANGGFWDQVSQLLSESAEDGILDNSDELMTLLMSSDNFQGLSEFGKLNWSNELIDEWHQAYEGFMNWIGYKDELKNKQNNQQASTTPTASTTTPTTATTSTTTTPTNELSLSEIKKGVAAAILKDATGTGAGWGHGPERVKNLRDVFGISNDVQDLINKMAAGTISMKGIDVSKFTFAKFKGKKYRTGGIVDFTGPAWLDGTHSKPESVLSARDTANFIQLRDILSDILKKSATNQTNGNTYFDIDINVDEIGSDYDVNQMAEQIKRQIYNDSKYRNINAISFIR